MPEKSPATTAHAIKNRELWTGYSSEFAQAGPRAWAGEPSWGIFGIPESEVGLFGDPDWLRDKDTIELGCGTAYVSAWLARLGALPVGIDVTPAQLQSASRLQREVGIHFPLIECSAERVPVKDASFDLAISEYGASIWCDPYLWIPEAARLLRPGGRLIFLRNSTIATLCTPIDGNCSPTLCNGWRELRCIEDENAVEFQIPHGEMIRLLRRHGFVIDELIELLAPDGSTTRFQYMPIEWAPKWPAEEIWKATKTSRSA